MPQLNGEIGTLIQGIQVGGFYDWQLDASLQAVGCEKWASYRLGTWKCTTSRYWLLEKPSSETFTARFYRLIRDKLVLINEVTVDIQIPNFDIKLHNIPLIMIWIN